MPRLPADGFYDRLVLDARCRLVGFAGFEPGGFGGVAGADQVAALAGQRLGSDGIACVERAVGERALDAGDLLAQALDLGLGLRHALLERRKRRALLGRLATRRLRRLLGCAGGLDLARGPSSPPRSARHSARYWCMSPS